MSTVAVITFMSGPRDGETVMVVASGAPPRVLIGRAVLADGLSLPWDPDASRTHASLTQSDGGWWLEDANSRNGTFIGEFTGSVRVSAPVRLAQNQVIRVGLTRLRIESLGTAETVAEASATGGLRGTR